MYSPDLNRLTRERCSELCRFGVAHPAWQREETDLRFLRRRLLHSVLVLATVSVLAFGIMQIAPGEFASDLKLDPRVSPATVAALRTQFGLDRPLPLRYVSWLGSLLRGDFGFSFAYNLPVRALLFERVRNTLLLTVTAALLAWCISIPVGVFAAVRAGSWFDRLVGGATSMLLAIPEITLALGLLLLAVRTRILPAGGMTSARGGHGSAAAGVLDLASHMVLPVVALVAASLPVLVRHVRASMVDVLGSSHIRTARAHGLPERLILLYALRAAANPLISFAGFSIATLLSGSLVVEVITSWPGMGPLMVESILARDVYVVVGAVLLSAVCLLLGNLIADLLLYAADPRIRMEDAA